MTAVAQPVGTVTLVFSDIEGSTRLLEELGTDAYREALAEHRRIVREAYGRYSATRSTTRATPSSTPSPPPRRGGSGRRGDGRPRADGPIRDPGRHPHGHSRPRSAQVRGHGRPLRRASHELGPRRPGRLSRRRPPSSSTLELTELGEHRLKDIAEAVALYQLGEGSFPPLKTISNTNLPRPASSFLGREAELAAGARAHRAGARLLTLTGPGGTGKTRLALEAASSLVARYKAGVFWVGLATLRDPALVTETIAQTLGAKDGLASHIGERQMLLLLDNLEQVIEARPSFRRSSPPAPTSPSSSPPASSCASPARSSTRCPRSPSPKRVALFCERAQLEPSAEIAELCARLDSLPLAVELAAARTKALSPAQILERLSQRLDLLKGGRDADPRQQTLRATIEWSYELLTPEEQQLFARLSVFAGGCTLEAAEEVADADLDTLQSLVEKSLAALHRTSATGCSRRSGSTRASGSTIGRREPASPTAR